MNEVNKCVVTRMAKYASEREKKIGREKKKRKKVIQLVTPPSLASSN